MSELASRNPLPALKHDSVLTTVGKTPLIKLNRMAPEGVDVFEAVFAALFELLERTWVQSGATIMDFSAVLERIRLAMVDHLGRRGTLQEMDTLVVDCKGVRDEAAAGTAD